MRSYNDMLQKGDWKPIPHCPGRFTLAGGLSSLTLGELLGEELPVKEFRSEKVPDKILVCELSGGGIISYDKGNQRFIHTLCSAEGFKRKMKHLGLLKNT